MVLRDRLWPTRPSHAIGRIRLQWLGPTGSDGGCWTPWRCGPVEELTG